LIYNILIFNNMSMIKNLLLSCTLLLFAWQVNAQTATTVYSGSSVPTEQGWTEQKLDATINTVAAPTTQTATGGVLKLTSTNAADQFSQLNWYRTDLDFDIAKGFTIEIKAKVTSADKTGAFNIQGYDRTGKGFRIGILDNAVTEQTDPFAATNVLASGLTNGDAFHVYRLDVTSNAIATVYRDGKSLGTFPLIFFQFDNIIENGGFEDKDFPDFLSNGTLSQVSKADDSKKVRYGDHALEMNNDALITDYNAANIEAAHTREIAVKPNTEYQIAITRRKTANEPWAWRDMGSFYDFNAGCLGLKGVKQDMRQEAEAGRDATPSTNMFASVNDRVWQIHNQNITTPDNAKTLRFEFPSWTRDGNKNNVTSSFDNFTFREKSSLKVGPTVDPAHGFPAVVLPEGAVNLIQNGGFEDWEMNNDGTPYTWALSDPNRQDGNDPFAANPLWNTNTIRIQRSSQDNDAVGADFAHSGNASLRFTTNGDNANNFDYAIELQAGKTYRFNFWHRSPKWDDWGWLKVRIGDNVIYGQELKGRNNVWANCDLVFTTTDENKTLHLYTTSADHGGWWNLYLDDLMLYEIPAGTPIDPQIAGKTNLIANGDFEDVTKGNDGQPYTWALASSSSSDDDNYPVKWSDVWGSVVRLQDKQKITDTGLQWAHSGTHSLRFSYLDDWGKAQAFEGITGDTWPDAFRVNMNFKKELEPNKTYTFVFWIKVANYGDKGTLAIANGDARIWDDVISTKYIDWTRQSITFSTTGANHTLRLFSEFGGWCNFYLDDLFLYQEDTYQPELAPQFTGDTYFAFGKSTGASSTNVEIEYISVGKLTGINTVKAPAALRIYPNPVVNGQLTIDNIQSAGGQIEIYSIMGTRVKGYDITGATTTVNVSSLPAGTYVVKVDNKAAVMLKK